jgi:NAD-dependent DNA ligase
MNTILKEKVLQKSITNYKNLSEKELFILLKHLDNSYYNDESIISDIEYDIMREYAENIYPDNTYFHCIGSEISNNEKIKLPVFMGSMNKIKSENNLIDNWIKKYKGNYVVSSKLDGVSGLYVKKNNCEQLFTRGNGEYGRDISKFIPYFNLPKHDHDIIIRGEFIMSKEIFDSKYKDKFSNSRNLISGIINKKLINETINDIDFVCYELIDPIMKPKEQLEKLSELNYKIVEFSLFDIIHNEILTSYLLTLRNNYKYKIDGLIITNNNIYERTAGNPEHSFAFKMITDNQIAEATVLDVLWTPSKNGYLKPRIQIKPVLIDNVSIQYLNGFNAYYIEQNKINTGTILQIIRSGDVIPHILNVVTSSYNGKMPDCPYKWTSSKIDIIIEDMENETLKLKQLTLFFKTLEVEDLSEKNVKKIMDSGNNTIEKIIQMKLINFLSIKGFQERMANKIYNGIHEKLNNATIEQLMVGSNIFNRGTSINKINLIFEVYPNLLEDNIDSQDKIIKITKIKGMSLNSATQFIEKLPLFLDFLNKILNETQLKKILSPIKKEIISNHILYKKTIVMTGFRNQELTKKIENVGGVISNIITNKTFILITQNLNIINTKMREAKKINIPILSMEEFIQQYFI